MIQVYRKGTSKTVRGVNCDVQNVIVNTKREILSLLEGGWMLSEQDLIEEVPETWWVEEAVEIPEVVYEHTESLPVPPLTKPLPKKKPAAKKKPVGRPKKRK